MLFPSGCAQKCEGFNNDIINWMPYKTSDKIPVTNDKIHDTLTVLYSDIHHTNKIAYGVKCACENSYNLMLSSDSLELEIYFNDSRDVTQSEIYINGEGMFYRKQMDKMEIMGSWFSDLIEYSKYSQDKGAAFDSIIIAKSVGIILIKGPDTEWTTVNDSEKNIEVSDLRFISKNCE